MGESDVPAVSGLTDCSRRHNPTGTRRKGKGGTKKEIQSCPTLSSRGVREEMWREGRRWGKRKEGRAYLDDAGRGAPAGGEPDGLSDLELVSHC